MGSQHATRRGQLMDLDHLQLAAPADCEGAARRFFGELLGLAEIPKPPALAERGGVWFRLGDDRQLHVGVVKGELFIASRAHPGFRVTGDEIDALANRLIAAGHPVVWAPSEEIPDLRRFHTTDPWGNRLEFLAPA